MNFNQRILKAISEGIQNALNFSLDDFNDADNDYIKRDQIKLDALDKQEIIGRQLKVIKSTLEKIKERALTDKEKEDFLEVIENPELTSVISVQDKKELLDIIKNLQIRFQEQFNTMNLNWIDVSNVTDFTRVFQKCKFNGDISKWDVSKSTSFNYMFYTTPFGGDVSNWNVSDCSSFRGMFYGDSKAKLLDLSKWDMHNAKDISYMFAHDNFNGDISNWDVSNVESINNLFDHSKFNNDISNWDVSNIKYVISLFDHSEFNQDISKWKLNIDDILETNKFSWMLTVITEHGVVMKSMLPMIFTGSKIDIENVPSNLQDEFKKVMKKRQSDNLWEAYIKRYD